MIVLASSSLRPLRAKSTLPPEIPRRRMSSHPPTHCHHHCPHQKTYSSWRLPHLQKHFRQAPETITVERFEVVGSTVFSPEQLAKVLAPFTKKPISFALFQARSCSNEALHRPRYTSGAYIPPQRPRAASKSRWSKVAWKISR